MQSKIADMEATKAGLEREIYTLQKENKKSVQLTKSLQKEVEEIRSSVQEILTLLDPAEVNKEQVIEVPADYIKHTVKPVLNCHSKIDKTKV